MKPVPATITKSPRTIWTTYDSGISSKSSFIFSFLLHQLSPKTRVVSQVQISWDLLTFFWKNCSTGSEILKAGESVTFASTLFFQEWLPSRNRRPRLLVTPVRMPLATTRYRPKAELDWELYTIPEFRKSYR